MKQTEKAKNAGMNRPSPEAADERTPTTPLRESHALEDDDLVQSVQDKMDEIATGNSRNSIRTSKRNPAMEADEDDLDFDDEELEEEDDELGDDQEDDLGTSDDGSDGEGEGEEDGEKEGEEEPAGLSDALVRSAVALGWGTKEEAVKYYKEDPQRALEVFNRIYRARLQATSEYARLGQAARQKQETDNAPASKTVTPEQLAKLKETFGEEAQPLLDIIETQQDMINQLGPKTQKEIQKRQEPTGLAGQGLVDQQIDTFFASDSMKPWQKLYGSIEFGQDWEDLTPSQQRYRHNVLIKTNDILGGAQLHGRQVTLPQALEEAHLIVTQQFRDNVIVASLKKNAVKRHKAISVKPSQSKAKKSRQSNSEFGVPGKRTPEQRELAVQAKMRKVFNK